MRTVLVALLVFAGCGERVPAQARRPAPAQIMPNQIAPVPLMGTHWTLVAVGDLTLPAQHDASGPHLVFHVGGNASGADGCNTFRTTYTADRFTMTFGVVAGTTMVCRRPDRLDARIREALGLTRRWSIEERTLTLFDADGVALARFEQRFEGR